MASIIPELTCPSCSYAGRDYKIEAEKQHQKCSCAKCGAYIKFLSKEDKYGTKEQQEAIWEKTMGRCCYCGKLLNPFAKNGYTYEHVLCQKLGGGHDSENLMPCCKSCNSQKGAKTLGDYRKYLAEKFGTPTHVFYYEVQEYSTIGQLSKSMFPTKKIGDL